MMSDIMLKKVELLMCCGIINSLTKLHLVGYCYYTHTHTHTHTHKHIYIYIYECELLNTQRDTLRSIVPRSEFWPTSKHIHISK
jgi:hypothetical protein